MPITQAVLPCALCRPVLLPWEAHPPHLLLPAQRGLHDDAQLQLWQAELCRVVNGLLFECNKKLVACSLVA